MQNRLVHYLLFSWLAKIRASSRRLDGHRADGSADTATQILDILQHVTLVVPIHAMAMWASPAYSCNKTWPKVGKTITAVVHGQRWAREREHTITAGCEPQSLRLSGHRCIHDMVN